MEEAEERWANHQGSYMTLDETLVYTAEQAKQAGKNAEPAETPVVVSP